MLFTNLESQVLGDRIDPSLSTESQTPFCFISFYPFSFISFNKFFLFFYDLGVLYLGMEDRWGRWVGQTCPQAPVLTKQKVLIMKKIRTFISSKPR